MNIEDRAAAFKNLHHQRSLFVMPCAWDAFTAMLFERSGFACIGTTSGGVNWVNGRRDYVYSTPREDMLQAYGEIAAATSLPVSGDLENGYGGSPTDVAETISESIAAGMVGGSIEDVNIVPSNAAGDNGELYAFDVAVERIKAAADASNAANIPYTLTARCEVYYTQSTDPYGVAVDRLNAYHEAGADCLFVPGLNDVKQLEQLVRDVNGPISFGMGATPEPITLTMLEDIGIKRVSTGAGLTRATFALIENAAKQIQTEGRFDYLQSAISEADVHRVIPAGT